MRYNKTRLLVGMAASWGLLALICFSPEPAGRLVGALLSGWLLGGEVGEWAAERQR